MDHESFMRAALEEARRAGRRGDRPIGCVIVRGSAVIAAAGNRVHSTGSELDHAEIAALRAAADDLRPGGKDCTLYTTLEPCVMCLGAIAASGVAEVFFGEADPRRGGTLAWTHVPFLRSRIRRYRGGLLAEACASVRAAAGAGVAPAAGVTHGGCER